MIKMIIQMNNEKLLRDPEFTEVQIDTALIMLGLKNQKWFMNNAKEWILCNSDDSDDPEYFDEEDLLAHYARNVVA